jgi:hypothetical protein
VGKGVIRWEVGKKGDYKIVVSKVWGCYMKTQYGEIEFVWNPLRNGAGTERYMIYTGTHYFRFTGKGVTGKNYILLSTVPYPPPTP